MRADLHQHIWTDPLVEALARRDALPFIRETRGLTMLYCAGEQPWVIDRQAETPDARARLLVEDQLDLALIALSSPLGIEALPREAAVELIDAHLAGVRLLGEGFAAWGPVALDDPDPDDVDDLGARGCLGISLPAGALAGPDRLYALGPVLERAAQLAAPLLVHPGPAPGERVPEASISEPLWWRALTDYIAQMQVAWFTFAALGRREHPELTVVFATLAGGAPLLSERLAARGGPDVDLTDPNVFYDTSSYGAGAIEAMARRVGPDQLVYGSDRPVVEPRPTGWEALLQSNSARLVARTRAAV